MDDTSRNKILKYIKEQRVVTSSELAKLLGVSWNTAQAYLMELALEAKIIRIKKEGVNLWLMS
ncbi:winged helix-turn-helix transcriptional regulator [Candidatus Pacearchaeota archaeon]|nr:winged helix-turn-helix transcriptional regulator [Candidatus Pacearchaeota archaeon]